MIKTSLLTACGLILAGTYACGDSESDRFRGGGTSGSSGASGSANGGAAGTSAGSGGSTPGSGGSKATGGKGSGGNSGAGNSGGAGEAGNGATGGDSGAGGTTGEGGNGASGDGGASGDAGAGGEGGGACQAVHPNVNGASRTCDPGRCYCPANDGCFAEAEASSCCDEAVTCDPGAQNPVATINHPGDGETRAANSEIPFIGVAVDPQDGALTGASLVWTSSLSGQIGTGLSFNASLGAGTHLITLTATDSDSNTGTDSVTLDIQ